MAEIGFDGEKIIRYFRGKESDEDASYVGEVFRDKGKEKELEHFLRRQWYELVKENNVQEKNLDHVLYRIHYGINTDLTKSEKSRPFKNILRWFSRIAAILFIPLAIYFGIHIYTASEKKMAWAEINAPSWTRAQFSLPDGTIGWLNSNSSLKYNGNFNTDRRVKLTGEAFFDVFKDKKRPFIVNTNEVAVTVLGTRFNIASYENEKNVEVVLEEGILVFNDKEMNKSYTMKPNDLVVYDKALKDFSTTEVEPQKYLSWTDGKLVFRNDPLDVIARRLERWYNIDVDVIGCLSDDIRLRATFIDENLEQVLYFLKRSLPVDYRIENGEIQTDGIYRKTKVIITPRTK